MHHCRPRDCERQVQALAAERVTSTAQAPSAVSSYRAHEPEAQLLAELLRSTRLSLLYAEAGTDKTALLRFGLIPRLSRRAGDRLVPPSVRTSGVVVPFPDRRSRSSASASKRRRELVVYVDCSDRSPLGAVHEALSESVALDRTIWLQSNARLGELLEDVGRRFESHLIVLLDRFEDLPADSPHECLDQFASELAEAIRQPRLAASFLIAIEEDAKPRLAALRSRIPGFDDSSLRLTPAREFSQGATPAWPPAPADPAGIEALPILSEVLSLPEGAPMPGAPVVAKSTTRVPGKKKVKRAPLPRVEIRTEDVYAMIETALSRIVSKDVTGSPEGLDLPRSDGNDLAPQRQANERAFDTAASANPGSAPVAGWSLREAIERMEQRLRSLSEGRRSQ